MFKPTTGCAGPHPHGVLHILTEHTHGYSLHCSCGFTPTSKADHQQHRKEIRQ